MKVSRQLIVIALWKAVCLHSNNFHGVVLRIKKKSCMNIPVSNHKSKQNVRLYTKYFNTQFLAQLLDGITFDHSKQHLCAELADYRPNK